MFVVYIEVIGLLYEVPVPSFSSTPYTSDGVCSLGFSIVQLLSTLTYYI